MLTATSYWDSEMAGDIAKTDKYIILVSIHPPTTMGTNVTV